MHTPPLQRSNRRIVFTAPQTVEVQQEEVSTASLGPDELLVESLYSAVSAGTEFACLVAKRGELILLGSPRGEVQGDLTELLSSVHLWSRGCVTLKGAHEWRYPVMHDPNTKHSLERNSRVAWWLEQTGKLQLHKLITHIVRPDDAAAAYEGLRTRKDEYVGVVFDWS